MTSAQTVAMTPTAGIDPQSVEDRRQHVAPWSPVPSQNVPPVGDLDPGGSQLSMTSSCARS
jgi:hypothetical protein